MKALRTIAATLGADGAAHRAVQLGESMVRDADLVLVAESAQRDLLSEIVHCRASRFLSTDFIF